MDILELRGPHGWLRIFCLVVDKMKSPIAAEGYQHLRYQVGGYGFSGEGSGFVAEADLLIFCARLLELADGHDSEAQLSEQEAGGLSLTLRPGLEQDEISIEGRIVQKHHRTVREQDGLYTWAAQFGFSVKRHFLSGARDVRWVSHFVSGHPSRV